MAPDLAVNLPDVSSDVPPEERARQFLIAMSEHFGLERSIFERQLTGQAHDGELDGQPLHLQAPRP